MTDNPRGLASHEQWWESHVRTEGVTTSTFASWLAHSDDLSRRATVEIAHAIGARTVLEFGPGTFLDYREHWRSMPSVAYRAVELTPALVDYGRALGAAVQEGSIVSAMHYGRADFVYCRHVLEHLPHYGHALENMLAHATKAVVVVFFQLGEGDSDALVIDETVAPGTYCNIYSRQRLTAWLRARNLHFAWSRPGRDHVLTIHCDRAD